MHDQIRQLGAFLIMISPQSENHSKKFAEMKGLTMDLLVDSGNRVAEAYGLAFDVPEALREVYKKLGIDVAEYNDDGLWRLPMPARYIIDRNRIIRYADVNPDYTVRPDPSETIEALEKIIR